jgi:hypothetical protein
VGVRAGTFEQEQRAGSGGAVMGEITHEEALRQADALVGQALKEAEARCAVLAQYINGGRQPERAWLTSQRTGCYEGGCDRADRLTSQRERMSA